MYTECHFHPEYHEVLNDAQRIFFFLVINKTDNDKFCTEISLVRLTNLLALNKKVADKISFKYFIQLLNAIVNRKSYKMNPIMIHYVNRSSSNNYNLKGTARHYEVNLWMCQNRSKILVFVNAFHLISIENWQQKHCLKNPSQWKREARKRGGNRFNELTHLHFVVSTRISTKPPHTNLI